MSRESMQFDDVILLFCAHCSVKHQSTTSLALIRLSRQQSEPPIACVSGRKEESSSSLATSAPKAAEKLWRRKRRNRDREARASLRSSIVTVFSTHPLSARWSFSTRRRWRTTTTWSRIWWSSATAWSKLPKVQEFFFYIDHPTRTKEGLRKGRGGKKKKKSVLAPKVSCMIAFYANSILVGIMGLGSQVYCSNTMEQLLIRWWYRCFLIVNDKK